MEETNTPQNTQTPPNESPKPKKGMNKATALLLFIVIMGAATAGAYWLKQRAPQPVIPSNTPQPQPSPPAPNPSELPTYEYTPSGPAILTTVEWQYPASDYIDISSNPYISENIKTYRVGKIKNGRFKDQPLYIALVPCEGPCPATVLRIAFNADSKVSDKTYAIIQKNSEPLDNLSYVIEGQNPPLDSSKFIIDTNTQLVELDLPSSIGSGSKLLTSAEIGPFQAHYNIFNSTNLKPVFTDPKLGQVYTTPDDQHSVDAFFQTYGFYAKAPDWGTAVYKYTPDFLHPVTDVPQVIWSDLKNNSDEYSYVHIGKCGFSDYLAVVNIDSANLKLAGKTSKGQDILEFKDVNAQLLKDMYNNDYNPYDPNTYQPAKKIPYEQFVAEHPIFFWTDPFGRLVQFQKEKFILSAAECGKPVIYLYPTQTTDVSVKVDPKGGFTYTDPEYGTGWNATAFPDGKLIVNGKEYPYLFWEGRGGIYQSTPDRGFVVARGDVHNFLVEKLAKHGLNEKESADFIEFWEPKMNSAPYYFVTFMGNSIMDKIAPLTITPKPDTVIRVLMDFEPLEKPIEVQGYEIRTPERNGFTVVEWGGVLQ